MALMDSWVREWRRAVERSSISHPLQKTQRVGHPELGFPWEVVALGHPAIPSVGSGAARTKNGRIRGFFTAFRMTAFERERQCEG